MINCLVVIILSWVIINVLKMPYHDGKGDPTGIIALTKANRLAPKLLIRYVRNRFYVLLSYQVISILHENS